MNKLLLTFSSVLVASVTAISAHAQDIKGDAKAGEAKNAMCIGCHGIHGYQASFPEIYKVPKISGQNAKYIAGALNAYKKGERKHPSMRGIAEGKVEGAAVAKAAEPSAKAAELLNKGGCVACHGADFNKAIDPSYPKVAGQHADYLFVALKSYKTEGNATWGRANGIMGGVAKQFSNAELKELAAYISTLPGDVKTVPQKRFR